MRVSLILFLSGFLLLLSLPWLLWPTLPKLCWIEMVRVGTLVLFLILGEKKHWIYNHHLRTWRDTHLWPSVPMTPFPWLLGSVILQVCFIGLFFFLLEIHLTLSLQVFLRLYILPFPWSLSSTFILLPKHSEWLLCTQLIKWMVHSLRQSFLLLSDIASYIFY